MEQFELRPRGEAVCPLCRDPLGAEPSRCPECAVGYHPECRTELTRCATLDCPGLDAPRDEATPTTRPSAVRLAPHIDWPFWLGWVAVIGLAWLGATYGPGFDGGPAGLWAFIGGFLGLVVAGLLSMFSE